MAVRVFSMRTGLAASTVTPGSTEPDVSFMVPAMDCASAACGNQSKVATNTNDTQIRRILLGDSRLAIIAAFLDGGDPQKVGQNYNTLDKKP
jgi:hypothetical protein